MSTASSDMRSHSWKNYRNLIEGTNELSTVHVWRVKGTEGQCFGKPNSLLLTNLLMHLYRSTGHKLSHFLLAAVPDSQTR
jgi:hypothetical protein